MAQAIGSAGELIVRARLLVRGWTAGNVNTGGMMNAPAVDLLAAKGSRNIRVAVKTTGHWVAEHPMVGGPGLEDVVQRRCAAGLCGLRMVLRQHEPGYLPHLRCARRGGRCCRTQVPSALAQVSKTRRVSAQELATRVIDVDW